MLVEIMLLAIDKFKSRNGASVSEVLVSGHYNSFRVNINHLLKTFIINI